MKTDRIEAVERRPADERSAGGFELDPDVRNAVVLLAVSAVVLFGSRVLGPAFGSLEQAKAILIIASFVMVVAFGQQMVILIGGLDLSVASMMTLGGILAFNWIGGSASALIWGIPAILAVTGAIGALSGVGVSLLRIPPFIMTLAMGIILYGVILGFTEGMPQGAPSPALSWLFQPGPYGTPVLYIIPVAALAGWLFQVKTAVGRKLYALGTNPVAAHVAALPVRGLTIATYAISGASAGLAGIMMLGYVGGVTLMMGQSYLLPSIAAVVIGGTSILGGRGIYLGAVAGAILLTTLSTIVSSLGIAVGWRNIIYGVVILIALTLLRDDLAVLIQSLRRPPRT